MRARATRLCMFPKKLLGCHVAAVVGATVVGGLVSSSMQADAASDAANVQANASNAQIAQRQQQFDAMRTILQPWVDQGTKALTAQGDLIGLNGYDKSAAAIDAIKKGPQYTGLVNAGENAMRQNAAATGGLRGGNFQGALATFEPNILSGLIDQQYGRLTGLSSQGQNAGAQVGNNAVAMGNANATSIGDAAAAQAGAIMGGANAASGFINNAVNAAGIYAGAGGGFGSTYIRPTATTGGWIDAGSPAIA